MVSEQSKDTVIHQIQKRLQQLNPDGVRIIAVSKTHPPQKIRELLITGQRDFGESRQNEARDKFPLVKCDDLPIARQPVYHHIGPLQSGSARQIPGLFHYVHGVSSWGALDVLLRAVDKYRENFDEHYVLKYLLQIDLTREKSKAGGMAPEEFLKQDSLPKTTGCYPVGLMTMGPENQDVTQTRSVFRQLKLLRDEKFPSGELSMGMSGDWELAASEGSTMVRIGTAIFGPRNDRPWKASSST